MQDYLNENFKFLLEKIDENSSYKNKVINKVINLHKLFRNIDNSCREFIIESKIIIEIVLSNHLYDNNYIKEYDEYDLKTLLQCFSDNKIRMRGDVYYLIKWINEFRNKGSHEHEFKLTKFEAEHILLSLHRILSYFFNNDQEYIPLSKPEESTPITQTVEQKINKNTEICKRNLFEILNEDNISFFIPVYQRKYVWNDENVNVLFDDIKQRIQDNRDHYFGSIVIKKSINSNNVYRVVDGQQRLITSMLILLVIKELFKEMNINFIEELPNIINKNMDEVFVRCNVFGDENINSIFKSIWNGKCNYELNQKSPLILKNYYHIKQKLKNYEKNDLLIFVQTYLKKFQLSTIIFTNAENTPNRTEMEIYQNINSKGTVLELNELIKNYICISCDENVINEKEFEISKLYNRVFYETKGLDDFFKSLILYFYGDKVSENTNENLKSFSKILNDIYKINKTNYEFDEFKELMTIFEWYFEIYNSLNSSSGDVGKTLIGKYINKYSKFIISLLSYENKKRKLFIYLSYLICELEIMKKIEDDYNNLDQIRKIFEYFGKLIIKLSISYNKNGNEIRKFIIKQIFDLRNKYINYEGKISLSELANEFKNIYIKIANLEWNYADFINNLSSGYLNINLLKSILIMTEIYLLNGDKNKIDRIIDSNFLIEHIMPEEINSEEFKMGYDDEEWSEKYPANVNKIGNLLLVYKHNKTKPKDITFDDRNKKWENLELNIYKNYDESINVYNKIKWRIKDIEKRTDALIEIIKNFIN